VSIDYYAFWMAGGAEEESLFEDEEPPRTQEQCVAPNGDE